MSLVQKVERDVGPMSDGHRPSMPKISNFDTFVGSNYMGLHYMAPHGYSNTRTVTS